MPSRAAEVGPSGSWGRVPSPVGFVNTVDPYTYASNLQSVQFSIRINGKFAAATKTTSRLRETTFALLESFESEPMLRVNSFWF